MSARMTWLDVVLIALLAGSLYSGYRRGAVLQVIGLLLYAVYGHGAADKARAASSIPAIEPGVPSEAGTIH